MIIILNMVQVHEALSETGLVFFQAPPPPQQIEPVNQMLVDPRRSFCSLQPSPVNPYTPIEPESSSSSIMEMRNSHCQTYDRYETSPTR